MATQKRVARKKGWIENFFCVLKNVGLFNEDVSLLNFSFTLPSERNIRLEQTGVIAKKVSVYNSLKHCKKMVCSCYTNATKAFQTIYTYIK